jgi:hypothetical protein
VAFEKSQLLYCVIRIQHAEEGEQRIGAELKALLTIQETLLAKHRHWYSEVKA